MTVTLFILSPTTSSEVIVPAEGKEKVGACRDFQPCASELVKRPAYNKPQFHYTLLKSDGCVPLLH